MLLKVYKGIPLGNSRCILHVDTVLDPSCCGTVQPPIYRSTQCTYIPTIISIHSLY